MILSLFLYGFKYFKTYLIVSLSSFGGTNLKNSSVGLKKRLTPVLLSVSHAFSNLS